MNNKKIFNKLITAFAGVIVMCIILGALAIFSLNQQDKIMDDMYNEHLTVTVAYSKLDTMFEHYRYLYSQIALAAHSGKVAGFQNQVTEFTAFMQELSDAINNATNYHLEVESQFEYDNVVVLREKYVELVKIVIAESSKLVTDPANDAALIKALDDIEPVGVTIKSALNKVVKIEDEYSKKTNDDASKTVVILTTVISILLFIIILSSILIAFFISKDVEKQLKVVIGKLRNSTGLISSFTSQLSEASENLANGSSRQAAAIEETSATMNESASMIAKNADSTKQASIIAESSTKLSNQGLSKMSQMVSSMNELKESSDNIGRIVKVIDEIAFQTNILAINATVEAARAGGDAGRSFAVVAQEVRNLAQRSANAASDTTDIIEKNITLTNSSREESKIVASSLEEIAKENSSLSRIINEINAASEEQASGIRQINIAMSQMEKVTQQNAAVAEENAASANSMNEEIANLEDALEIAKEMIRDEK